MSLLDRFIAIIAPHRCIGCGDEGSLLCGPCRSALTRVPARCYRCRALTELGRTCQSCRATSALYRVTVGTNYETIAKELIWRLKFSGAQAAAGQIAEYLATVYVGDDQVLVVPVPTSSKRVRQRGYDQAQLLARELAQRLDRHYLPCLIRVGQQHQVGASRYQRLAQLSGAFRVNKNIVAGAHILLVDDVLTTGATLQAAARVMKAAGAKRVEAIVFAQA